MCLASSIYETRQNKKAADKAADRAEALETTSETLEDSAENAAAASEAAEQQAADVGESTDLSLAKRRRGVASTYLNGQLGS